MELLGDWLSLVRLEWERSDDDDGPTEDDDGPTANDDGPTEDGVDPIPNDVGPTEDSGPTAIDDGPTEDDGPIDDDHHHHHHHRRGTRLLPGILKKDKNNFSKVLKIECNQDEELKSKVQEE